MMNTANINMDFFLFWTKHIMIMKYTLNNLLSTEPQLSGKLEL